MLKAERDLQERNERHLDSMLGAELSLVYSEYMRHHGTKKEPEQSEIYREQYFVDAHISVHKKIQDKYLSESGHWIDSWPIARMTLQATTATQKTKIAIMSAAHFYRGCSRLSAARCASTVAPNTQLFLRRYLFQLRYGGRTRARSPMIVPFATRYCFTKLISSSRRATQIARSQVRMSTLARSEIKR